MRAGLTAGMAQYQHWLSPRGRCFLLVFWSAGVWEIGHSQGMAGRAPGQTQWHTHHPFSPGLAPQHNPRPFSLGQWAHWGSWSSCSSECGDGASVRARRCIRLLKQHPCAGEARQYRRCRMKRCPQDAVAFRAMQCALYNLKPFLRSQARYQWVPYHGAPNACELNCQALGANFYYSFGRVLDGTSCRPDSDDICINGHCLVAGCDGILRSDAPVNTCGTCQGRNDSCVFIQRVFRGEFPAFGFFGYKNVTHIPAGATDIKVMDHSRNFLALMNSNRRYVINGDWAMSWPGMYEVAGTTVNYTRSPENHESMEAIGPTQEDLYVMVLFQEQSPGIEYEFWLPRELYSTFQGNVSALKQSQPSEMHLGSLVPPTVPPAQKRSTPKPPRAPEKPMISPAPTAEGCGKCREAKGRSQRIRSYCRSDFVFRARILGKRTFNSETRYDVQVKDTYKNRYPLLHREYIWVSDTCDCPRLLPQRDYLLMAQRHIHYERALNRILLERDSYVRLWTPQEHTHLQAVPGHCTPSRPGRARGATPSAPRRGLQ